MLAKKKPKPITTYKDFFRACHTIRSKYGFQFHFHSTCAKVYDEHGRADANAIWWSATRGGSLWNPIEVINYVFYETSTGLWRMANMARPQVGLPLDKFDELVMAYRESEGHLTSLRERMCKALGLDEVPIHERPSYKRRRRK